MTIIEMREKRTKLLATMDGFLETHRDGKGILSAEDDATYSGMEKELAALTNEIKRMERQAKNDFEAANLIYKQEVTRTKQEVTAAKTNTEAEIQKQKSNIALAKAEVARVKALEEIRKKIR